MGIRAVHKIERTTGLYILRAVVNNGDDWRIWWFSADGHQHGWYDRNTREWAFDDEVTHFSPMCRWLFGDDKEGPRERDTSWGAVCTDNRWHAV